MNDMPKLAALRTLMITVFNDFKNSENGFSLHRNRKWYQYVQVREKFLRLDAKIKRYQYKTLAEEIEENLEERRMERQDARTQHNQVKNRILNNFKKGA